MLTIDRREQNRPRWVAAMDEDGLRGLEAALEDAIASDAVSSM